MLLLSTVRSKADYHYLLDQYHLTLLVTAVLKLIPAVPIFYGPGVQHAIMIKMQCVGYS